MENARQQYDDCLRINARIMELRLGRQERRSKVRKDLCLTS